MHTSKYTNCHKSYTYTYTYKHTHRQHTPKCMQVQIHAILRSRTFCGDGFGMSMNIIFSWVWVTRGLRVDLCPTQEIDVVPMLKSLRPRLDRWFCTAKYQNEYFAIPEWVLINTTMRTSQSYICLWRGVVRREGVKFQRWMWRVGMGWVLHR